MSPVGFLPVRLQGFYGWSIFVRSWNNKVKVRSPDGDREYFDNVEGVLQGDMLAPYHFIICLDYVLRTSIYKIRENGFELTKKCSRRYPAKREGQGYPCWRHDMMMMMKTI